MNRMSYALCLLTVMSVNSHAMKASAVETGPDELIIVIEGTCPGRLSVRWDGATPNHTGALVYSDATGNYVLPGPPCDGTLLGLGSSGIRLVRTFQTGPNGSGQMVGHAPAFACGGYLQVIVIEGNRPCPTSNAVQIPQ